MILGQGPPGLIRPHGSGTGSTWTHQTTRVHLDSSDHIAVEMFLEFSCFFLKLDLIKCFTRFFLEDDGSLPSFQFLIMHWTVLNLVPVVSEKYLLMHRSTSFSNRPTSVYTFSFLCFNKCPSELVFVLVCGQVRSSMAAG